VGWCGAGPLRRKPINLWIRGQRTKHHEKTLFPRMVAVPPRKTSRTGC
jgi:hypothetical protein